MTLRWPRIKAYGNWVLGLIELFIRSPVAHRYAMFQDDFVACRDLRHYLDRVPYPEKGYWNLYTFPRNQGLCPQGYVGFFKSDQLGKGLVANVFSREAVETLLMHQENLPKDRQPVGHLVLKATGPAPRSFKSVDGGICEALVMRGKWTEYVHNPSLVQHTGDRSTIEMQPPHEKAISFRGEDWSAMELLK
jgi:hypothetical protein